MHSLQGRCIYCRTMVYGLGPLPSIPEIWWRQVSQNINLCLYHSMALAVWKPPKTVFGQLALGIRPHCWSLAPNFVPWVHTMGYGLAKGAYQVGHSLRELDICWRQISQSQKVFSGSTFFLWGYGKQNFVFWRSHSQCWRHCWPRMSILILLLAPSPATLLQGLPENSSRRQSYGSANCHFSGQLLAPFSSF